jgi:hypothetical protein
MEINFLSTTLIIIMVILICYCIFEKKIEILKTFFTTILIPIAIAMIGYFVQQAATDSQYIQIATQILQNKELNKNNISDSDKALKKWAAEILNKKSPIPIENALLKDISNGNTFFPYPLLAPISSDYNWDGKTIYITDTIKK